MTTNSACSLIDMETLERIAPIIRHTAHPLRLRILDFLSSQDEPQTVTAIIEACKSPQAIVSQQLRILKDQNVLTARRDRNHVKYSVANNNVLLLLDCIRRH